jgi:hypothetical protein
MPLQAIPDINPGTRLQVIVSKTCERMQHRQRTFCGGRANSVQGCAADHLAIRFAAA